jgi:hypothetical protein
MSWWVAFSLTATSACRGFHHALASVLDGAALSDGQDHRIEAFRLDELAPGRRDDCARVQQLATVLADEPGELVHGGEDCTAGALVFLQRQEPGCVECVHWQIPVLTGALPEDTHAHSLSTPRQGRNPRIETRECSTPQAEIGRP